MNAYFLGSNSFRVLFKIFTRYQVIGAKNIPQNGAAILVSNHISNWDPPLVGSASKRQVHFIAKAELFQNFLLGFLLKLCGVIRLKRGRSDREAISKALEVLKQGRLFGIFIEGRRNKVNVNQMQPPQHGAAMIALKSKAPVIPIILINSHQIFKGYPRLQIIIGKPVALKIDQELDKKKLYQSISEQIVAAIEALRPKAE